MSVRDALDAVGLGQAARSCAADLAKLGVKAETDLASLTDEELQDVGLNPVQRCKLRALIGCVFAPEGARPRLCQEMCDTCRRVRCNMVVPHGPDFHRCAACRGIYPPPKPPPPTHAEGDSGADAALSSGVGNVFVKNLDRHIDNKALYDTFSLFGNILSCKVASDPAGKSRGYGFVHYETEEAAKQASEHVNGRQIGGETVQVDAFVMRGSRELAATDVAAGAGDGMEGAAEVFGFFASLAPDLSGSDTADLWEWSKEALTAKEKRKLRDERALSRAPPQRA